MALRIEHSQEQREAQGRVIAQVFGLKNADDVGPDWSLDALFGDGALLKVTLIKTVDRDTVNALVNGKDLATPGGNA